MEPLNLDDPDIRSIHQPDSWLVIGWFTPDYEQLAERFAANLDAFAVPHHLFASEAFGTSFFERTRRKPQIVLKAMSLYPDKTLILMDVDCVVRGNLRVVADIANADVSFYIKARRQKLSQVAIAASSRVMVVRPTSGAHDFIQAWADACEALRSQRADDETALTSAFVHNARAVVRQLPIEHSGREISGHISSSALIAHTSENGRRNTSVVSKILKAIERKVKAIRLRPAPQ
jgi:hypothetical protein